MPSKKIITNRSKQLLIIPLNSGDYLHLGAGVSSPPIEDYQLNDNKKVAKLESQQLIESTAVEDTSDASPQSVETVAAEEEFVVGTRAAAKKGRR